MASLVPSRLRLPALALAGLLILVAAFVTASRPGRTSAQDASLAPTETPSTMYVSGHGTVTTQPDTALLTFGVTIDADTLAEAQAEATDKMAAILAEVTKAGIADKDVQTVNYNVSILYDYDDNGYVSRVIGYEVTNQVNVKVRDLDAVGPLLDAVVAQGANNVYGISFYVEDTSAAASQARRAAVEDAMTKGRELAEAAGMQISRVLTISETSSPPPTPVDYNAAPMAADEAAGGAVPIQTGSTEITADVDIVFELEPAS
jgi:uncharacterized protein YggE